MMHDALMIHASTICISLFRTLESTTYYRCCPFVLYIHIERVRIVSILDCMYYCSAASLSQCVAIPTSDCYALALIAI